MQTQVVAGHLLASQLRPGASDGMCFNHLHAGFAAQHLAVLLLRGLAPLGLFFC
jgi:hypothetical protein